ncbi:MAG: alanine dehydrogenase [Thermodesulfovibrionales bacterium]|nr:alanine dehydrogenase [Thermodesulfovibrionales bacterium]
MVIGVPKEIKPHEYRVAVTPQGAAELRGDGHRVLIEKNAGDGSGFPDGEYENRGAEITDKERLFSESGLIVKVKEPLQSEYGLFRRGQTLFTYLHLAPNAGLTIVLMEKGVNALGYETLEKDGCLPLLTPMSEIAGRMSPLVAAYYLQRPHGGSGVLPSGVAGVPPADILIIGAGVVGTNAARVALGLGMRVTVLNRGIERLRHIDEMFRGAVTTLPSNGYNIKKGVAGADIVIGAVLLPGAKAPVIVTREMVAGMKKGSVVVDVSIDQGGCIETSRPTTHDNPVYEEEGVIHYAVTNMPGAYPRTSTMALTNSTIPYIRKLALMGVEKAASEDGALRTALNIYKGKVVHKALSESTGLPLGGVP